MRETLAPDTRHLTPADDRTAGVLLAYQQKWIADTSEVKVCEKSRRVGITWAEAADDALYAASETGGDVWYIGYSKDMAIEFVSDCGMWAQHYHLAASALEEEVFEDAQPDGSTKKILTYKISFTSGHRITALSSRPTNLRGKQGRVILDEAAFHDDLPGLIKAAVALIMWGGSVRVISTHNGADNPFCELIAEIRAGKKPYALHTITLDDALHQGLYVRICQKLKRDYTPEGETAWREQIIAFYGDSAEEELFVIPARGGGVYLPRTLVERSMRADLPVLRLSCREGYDALPDAQRAEETAAWIKDHLEPLLDGLDQDLKHFYGMDFGRTGDLSVIVPLQEQPNLTYLAPFIVELRNVPFKQQEQILFAMADRLPRFMAAAHDARGNGSYLAEVAMQRYGSERVEQVKATQDWYRDNMPRVKSHFEAESMLLPKDSDLLSDFGLVIMEKGVAKVPDDKHTKGTDGKQRHGDGAIGVAMAVYATTLDGGETKYETVQKREQFEGFVRGAAF